MSVYITHLAHLEDLLIEGSFPDFKDMVLGILSGNAVIQSKIDGSPSLFFGYSDGFFLSTKSLFNKTPKIIRYVDDIPKLFNSPGLQDILTSAYTHLSGVYMDPGVVYQGDAIFGDKRLINGSNGSYITFTPNTITYTVDVDSHLYPNIRDAQFGIVVHTKYNDADPYDFDYIVGQSNKDLFITSNIIPNKEIDSSILCKVNDIEKIINSNDILNRLTEIDYRISDYIQTFVNSYMDKDGIFDDAKNNKPYDGNKYFSSFLDYCLYKYDTIPSNIGDMRILRDRVYKLLLKKKHSIILLFWCYYQAIKIKHSLLNSIDHQLFNSDYNEGIVASNNKKSVKLVDRTEFSRLNRAARR